MQVDPAGVRGVLAQPSKEPRDERHAGAFGEAALQAAECETIKDSATDKTKRELFAKLAQHFEVLAAEVERAMLHFGPEGDLARPRTAPRYQATKSSHHEINKAFEGRNYKPRRKHGSAKIKQFTQGFALLIIKQ
jgi:hypothetical protein